MSSNSKADFEPIVGRYLRLAIGGKPHRLYVEEAGRAFPCCACTPRAPTAGSTARSSMIAKHSSASA